MPEDIVWYVGSYGGNPKGTAIYPVYEMPREKAERLMQINAERQALHAEAELDERGEPGSPYKNAVEKEISSLLDEKYNLLFSGRESINHRGQSISHTGHFVAPEGSRLRGTTVEKTAVELVSNPEGTQHLALLERGGTDDTVYYVDSSSTIYPRDGAPITKYFVHEVPRSVGEKLVQVNIKITAKQDELAARGLTRSEKDEEPTQVWYERIQPLHQRYNDLLFGGKSAMSPDGYFKAPFGKYDNHAIIEKGQERVTRVTPNPRKLKA